MILKAIFIISISTILCIALTGVLIARIEAVLWEEENIYTYLWAASGGVALILLAQVWLEIIITNVYSCFKSAKDRHLDVEEPSDSEDEEEIEINSDEAKKDK